MLRLVLRPVVFFVVARLLADVERAAVRPVPDRDVVARDFDVPLVLRARDVPVVERAREVPVVLRVREVPVVERAREVPVVLRDVPVVERAREVPVVLRVRDVPVVERAREVPVVLRVRDVPVVERAREVPVALRARDVPVELRELVAFLARVPVVFFAVVEPLRLVVDRAELRDVPDLARVVPEVDRRRVPVVERRGDAARTRERDSSVGVSSATDSAPKRSGIKPGVLIDSGVKLSPIDSDGLCSSSGSGVKLGSPNRPESSSRLSPSK